MELGDYLPMLIGAVVQTITLIPIFIPVLKVEDYR